MQPKISVIIPIYNSSKYLRECLDSIANQTLKKLQVILIDDGSTDSSADICREYVKRYPGFEYYYKDNGGSASARNIEIDQATGEYIGFVDSDDTIKSEFFEILYSYAKNHNADIVYLPFAAGKQNAECYDIPQSGLYYKSQIKHEIIPNVLPHINKNGTFRSIDWGNWSRLIRSDMIKTNNVRYFTGSRRCEDLAFMLECTIHAESYFIADDCGLYYYRPSETSKSRHYTKNMWESISSLMLFIHNIITKNDIQQIRFNECLFYFCCMVIKNEIFGAEKRNLSQNIKRILNDSLCKKATMIDFLKLNSHYKAYYNAISSFSVKKAVGRIQYYEWRRKNISPFFGRLVNCKIVHLIYKRIK